MAYSDYGANVYLNGKRTPEYEDAHIYDNDEGGEWEQACRIADAEDTYHWLTSIHHGIIGDDKVRVICHKQHFPDIYALTERGLVKISVADIMGKEYSIKISPFNWGKVSFSYKGYAFEFSSGDPYDEDSPCVAVVTTPNGDVWLCEYDYGIE